MIWAQLGVLALSLVLFLATLGLGKKRESDTTQRDADPAATRLEGRGSGPRRGRRD